MGVMTVTDYADYEEDRVDAFHGWYVEQNQLDEKSFPLELELEQWREQYLSWREE